MYLQLFYLFQDNY